MTVASRLDGAVPADAGARQDAAITALTRRVAELERRLNVMKVIVGLVLAAKVVIVALLVYVLLASSFAVRSGNSTLRITAITRGAG